jgi:hypothetical protein
MFFEVSGLTYHSPITIASFICGHQTTSAMRAHRGTPAYSLALS